MNAIYLDANATTPIDPQAVRAMFECWEAGPANPSSQHRAGQRARLVLEQSLETIGRLLGAQVGTMHSDRVLLTSGGTEANNWAISRLATGAASAGDGAKLGDSPGKNAAPGRIVISAIEHPSVVGAAERLEAAGFELQRLPVDRSGVVRLEPLEAWLSDGRTRVVSVMLGNNETGVLQPVAEIAGVCRQFGVPMHTDAVQVAGKLPIRFRDLGVTAMTVAAHKFHGPVGVGALLLRHDATLEPLLFGGFQQLGLRPGTEPVALAVGMRTALERWQAEAEERTARVARQRDWFESQLVSELGDIVIHGAESPRLPNTANLSFLGVDRQALFLALDMAGVACSTGSACASGSSEPSPVLLAMGLSPAEVASALRFSLSARTSDQELNDAVRRIIHACRNLRQRKIGPTGSSTGVETATIRPSLTR